MKLKQNWYLAVPLAFAVFILQRHGLRLLDDGYYYLQVAYNVSVGRGFTFDGINLTNGVQPLWLILLIPFFLLTKDKLTAAYAVTFFQILLFTGIGIMLRRLYQRLNANQHLAWLPAVVWLCNPYFMNKAAWTGMETALLLFLCSLMLYHLTRFVQGSSSGLLAGFLLMLTVASRLDAVFLALAIGVVIPVFCKDRRHAFLKLIAPSGIFLLFYCGLNYRYFGNIMPISGYLKSYGGKLFLQRFFSSGDLTIFKHTCHNLLDFLTLGGRLSKITALCIGGIGAGAVIAFMKNIGGAARIIILSLLLYCAFLLLYYAAFYTNMLTEYTYYWFPIFFVAVLCAALAIGSFKPPVLRNGSAFGCILSMLIFSSVYFHDIRETFVPDISETAVEYINERLAPDSVIGSWDAGYVGYFSNKPVINLDNLINNFELFDYIQNGRLPDYIKMKGITHLANVDAHDWKRGWIEGQFDARLIFFEGVKFNRLTTRFHLSPLTQRYITLSKGRREFFIYEIKPKTR